MQQVHDRAEVWGAAQRALRVQVLGAATPVGRELSTLLLELGHPPGNLALAARRPHALQWHGTELAVGALDELRFVAEVVFLCSAHPDALRSAELQLRKGSRLIDLSGAYRGRRDVALAAPGTDAAEIGVFTQMVALPQRSALLVGPLLWALHRACELIELSVVLLASVAGEGARGMLDLIEELRDPGRPEPPGEVARLGNVLPAPSEGPGREGLFARELAQLVGRRDLPVDATILRVDTERCDTLAFHLRCGRPVGPEEVRALAAGLPGVSVIGDEDPERLTPRALVGLDRLHVGRIRAGSRGPGSVCFVAVGDQLRAGAARPALQVAARFSQA